ncbi:MAG TPA: DUF3019 domain-containing protein [Cellvibrionaceae bacterium]|nr:DUF3019 domain-containing protein [Cellvibrionaceae bacterium]HMW46851.1 DUF3019 domain-containing protein [Cellvibrionaceae bacterium]HMW72450.1 DUF3019 domain-containing protein [Cellvibrionaceae bacterium]HMY37820.1 DUF3019 domain-containing protein [Marinagarivorans sp.]HNG59008.1 DUF3019 domain-containing protein [Cellvibrionaceae bacterium]
MGFATTAAALEHNIELTLTPRLCVLGEAEQECGGTVTLRWQAPAALNTCLYQEGRAEPLHCWQQVALGEFTLAPKANRSLRFYLAAANGSILADGTFQVLQQQNAHRKRRNPWSFY